MLSTEDVTQRAARLVAARSYPALVMASDRVAQARAEALVVEAIEAGLSPEAYVRAAYETEDGTLGLSAHMIAARIRRCGRYDYRPVVRSPFRVLLQFLARAQVVDLRSTTWAVLCGHCGMEEERQGEERPDLCRSCRQVVAAARVPEGWRHAGFVDWTLQRAQAAGIVQGDPWKDPLTCLWVRAVAEGARHHCPDLFGAVYGEGERRPGADADKPGAAPAPLFAGERAPWDPEAESEEAAAERAEARASQPWSHAQPMPSAPGSRSMSLSEVRTAVGAVVRSGRGLPASARGSATVGSAVEDVILFAWPRGVTLAWRYSHRAAKAAGGDRWIVVDRFEGELRDLVDDGVCLYHGEPDEGCDCPALVDVRDVSLEPRVRTALERTVGQNTQRAEEGANESAPPADDAPAAGSLPAAASTDDTSPGDLTPPPAPASSTAPDAVSGAAPLNEADEATDEEFGAEVARQFLGRDEAAAPRPNTTGAGEDEHGIQGAGGDRGRAGGGEEGAGRDGPDAGGPPHGARGDGPGGRPAEGAGGAGDLLPAGLTNTTDAPPAPGLVQPSEAEEASSPAPESSAPGQGPSRAVGADGLDGFVRYRCQCGAEVNVCGYSLDPGEAPEFSCRCPATPEADEPKPDSLWPGEECDPLTCRHRDEPDPESAKRAGPLLPARPALVQHAAEDEDDWGERPAAPPPLGRPVVAPRAEPAPAPPGPLLASEEDQRRDRAAKWRVRPKTASARKDVGICAECDGLIGIGQAYYKGVSGWARDVRLTPRGAPCGVAHARCVQSLFLGQDPKGEESATA